MTDPLHDLFRLTGVPSAVVAARAAADTVLRDRGARLVPAEMSARALLAGARASAAIEDAQAPGPAWEPGAVRISTDLIDLAGAIRRSPGQALARAHLLLARGVLDEARLGQVPATDPARLQGVVEVLARPTQAPAPVVAAIVHAEIALLAPPGGGHGILARAAEHMVLIEAGVDSRAVLVIEEGHRAAGVAYHQALAAYATGSVQGVRDWLLHSARALTRGAEVSPLASRPAVRSRLS